MELNSFFIVILDMVYKCCNSQPGELKLIRTSATTVLFIRNLFSDVSFRKIYFIASIIFEQPKIFSCILKYFKTSKLIVT